MWETLIAGDYVAGQLSAADFTLYPLIALALRIGTKSAIDRLTAVARPKDTSGVPLNFLSLKASVLARFAVGDGKPRPQRG